MSWFNRFAKTALPDVRPGQVSIPDPTITNTIGKLAGFYAFANPTFPVEFLEVLGPLGIFNPDVSQALSIWVNLGNTGHEVSVDSKNPEAVLQRLNWLAANIYRTGGGVDSLVNHFLRQIPLMGALSGEWVVAPDIRDGMIDVVVVPVRSIRFKYNEGLWLPYQLSSVVTGDNMGYVPLNPFTYSYSPLQTDDGCPYGIPPFYAALKNIETQLDATANIASIIRKMGLLGFLDVSLEVPERKAAESDQAYQARMQTRLGLYAKSYQQNLSKGVAVHYKDQEIKHNTVAPGAAAGAKQVWELNEEQIFSALDIPPSMAGRSYSTTETYAEVDFQRLTTKLVNGRRIIKRFLEKGYGMDLLLRGIDAQVSVTFNADSGYKALEQAEAEEVRIKNVLSKRDGGLINDDEAARELGYEKATGRRPGDTPPDGFFGSAPSLIRGGGGGVRFTFNRKSGRYEHKPEVIVMRSFEQPADDRADQNYMTALQAVLEGPEQAAIAKAIAKAEAVAGEKTTAKQFAIFVYTTFADTLRAEIAKTSIMKVCRQFTGNEWRRWRYEDKNHLSTARRVQRLAGEDTAIDIGLVDRNAIKYITNVEEFYFGTGNYLVKHPKQGNKFISWLQNEYIEKGLSIRDEATWAEFQTKFKGLVRVTSYQKIETIVSTTMGRIQNMGQTLSLYEAGMKRYVIVGPSTYPICAHCTNMLGRIFEVKVAAERLAKILEKGVEKDGEDLILPPFLSSKYTADQIDKKEMSDAELQAAGFETPPFHPKCRHRKAAVD